LIFLALAIWGAGGPSDVLFIHVQVRKNGLVDHGEWSNAWHRHYRDPGLVWDLDDLRRGGVDGMCSSSRKVSGKDMDRPIAILRPSHGVSCGLPAYLFLLRASDAPRE